MSLIPIKSSRTSIITNHLPLCNHRNSSFYISNSKKELIGKWMLFSCWGVNQPVMFDVNKIQNLKKWCFLLKMPFMLGYAPNAKILYIIKFYFVKFLGIINFFLNVECSNIKHGWLKRYLFTKRYTYRVMNRKSCLTS